MIKVKEVSKNFEDFVALDNITCNISDGCIYGMVGSNGAGKSTFLRVLAGIYKPEKGEAYICLLYTSILGTLDKPDEGNVCIDGINIAELKDRQLSKFRRENIGYIYQDYSLIPEYTAYENIVLPLILDNKDIDGDEVRELMSSLQIEYCYEKYPYEMSGGEQQRVAIARALINHPAVVYADEPTGNLDAGSSENVAAMLALAASKYRQTIIMVTHDKQMAGYADRVLSIVDGNVSSEVVV